MKKKIYIAGKINGLDKYKELFKRAEDKLTSEGYICMNPAILKEGFDYNVYLPICLAMLEACDSIYMLNNWETSKGAKVEHAYAVAQGKEILYQEKEASNPFSITSVNLPKLFIDKVVEDYNNKELEFKIPQLKPLTYYAVDIKFSKHNLTHKCILATGFTSKHTKEVDNCYLFNRSYEEGVVEMKIEDIYYFRIIEELKSMERV